MGRVSKRSMACLGFIVIATIGLYACGESSSSPSSDPGPPNTLVTSVNGDSNVICAANSQCIDFSSPFSFGVIAKMSSTLSQVANSWTNTSTNIIDISEIPYVDGSNSATAYAAAGSVFAVTTDAYFRYFKGNGLPSTHMGTFPVQSGTAAYSYYAALPGGTNSATNETYSSAAAIGISPYDFTGALPLNPVATGYYPINSLIVGITLTGAAWHVEKANDASGNWYSPSNALPYDQCWGHPYNQQYHHHGYSWKCFPNQGTSGQSPVFGYALDGFPITGPRGADGQLITNAQLDQCHGMTSEITMPDGSLKATYHYVLNREYPYSVGCFRGKVNYYQALGSDIMRQTNLPIYQNVPYPGHLHG